MTQLVNSAVGGSHWGEPDTPPRPGFEVRRSYSQGHQLVHILPYSTTQASSGVVPINHSFIDKAIRPVPKKTLQK